MHTNIGDYMKNKSIWLKDIKPKKNIEKLNNDIDVDILIIGGGIAGIQTAFNLNNSGKNICLIDKGKIGFGTSSCSTGKLTFLQSDMLYKIQKIHGFRKTKQYYYSTKEAIDFVKNTVLENNIECDFEEVPSYLYTVNDDENKILNETAKFLKRVNQEFKYVDNDKLPFKINKCIKVENTAIFNPVKYIIEVKKICNNIKFYENVTAIDIKKFKSKYIIKTNVNTIKAKKVVVTTHYPFFITPGLIPLKTHLERSYIAAFKYNILNKMSGINLKKPTLSIRSYDDDYLLYSSCSHKMTNHINYEERYKELILDVKNKFDCRIDYIWMAHDITSNDILPLIGKLDKNLFVATAFNKWGMTNGTIAGLILSDLCTGKKNAYSKLFSPSRDITLKKIVNFFVDMTNITKIYTATTLIKNHSFYRSNVYVKYINDELCGIYIDASNKKHIVKNKCPHMKCNLIFNSVDKTWDCPCHGSRFDIDGNIIEGPSTYNIKID